MAAPVSSLLSSAINGQCVYNVIELDGKAIVVTVACPQTTPPTEPPAGTTSTGAPASTTPNPGLTSSAVVSTSLGGSNISGVPGSSPKVPVATSSSATAAMPTGPAAKDSKGLAGGAVAGIAIGMLLAGALITTIVLLLFLRRQRRRNTTPPTSYSRHHAPDATRNTAPEKGVTVTAAPRGTIEDLLPQPVEDGAIINDLSKIRDNIKNYVRTYYHSGPISAGNINEPGLRDLAALTGTSAATVVSVLSNPTTRDHALRLIVGFVILTRCTGERSPSLLPSDVVALSASTLANNGSHSQSILYSKWKVITGALLQQRNGRQNQDPSQAQAFEDTVVSLESIMAPFAKSTIDGIQRRKNLDMILTRAANLAFLLFTQPGSFRFDFATPQGGLTVFPALLQTVGDQGQPLSPIKILTEKEVVAV
ncbi:hypothetical protein E8E13_010399 [Curvularia kusanoi]|uniref:Uncharacterized protein n=1 Tax=Curvularia kusanoi TaxID=90978 RepID=A0A9P4THL1_CURKU|nr:hypothetical protein E8E13_010399 [Curvularia kusanoi]